jgi:hypothetical protein
MYSLPFMDLPDVTVLASTLTACIMLESFLVDEIYNLENLGDCDD